MDALPSPVDALVVGTGLVESMIAAALARCGDSVLHVDRNEFYGSDGAGFSLEACADWASTPKETTREATTDEAQAWLGADARAALEAEGLADVAVAPLRRGDAFAAARSATPLPRDWEALDAETARVAAAALADAVAAAADDGAAAAAAAVVDGLVSAACATAAARPRREMARRAKRFNVDLDARALFASGDAVEGLVKAGVGHYLEFLAHERVFFFGADGAAPVAVPCSKRDVFASTALGVVDKRRLMRLLQFAADWGEREVAGGDAATLNERALTASRGLRRPQNKRVDGDDAGDDDDLDAPFVRSLAAKDELSPLLARVVAYALAFVDDDGAPRRAGLASLYAHLRALARAPEGSTALLAPLYGSAELAQAFCRAAAVRGAVYALRTAPAGLVMASAAGGPRRVVGALFAADGGGHDLVRCGAVVVGGDYVAHDAAAGAATRRIAVLDGPLRTGGAEHSRWAAVFEPRSGDNAVRGFVLDASTYATPERSSLTTLHLATHGGDADAQFDALARASARARALGGREELWALELAVPLHAGATVLDAVENAAVVARGAPVWDLRRDLETAAAAFAKLKPGAAMFEDPRAAEEAAAPAPDDDDDDLDDLGALLESLDGGAEG